MAFEEWKEEQKKLETIMERHVNCVLSLPPYAATATVHLSGRHKALIPRIQETLIKTECYWKCYSYGDDLLPIFDSGKVAMISSMAWRAASTITTFSPPSGWRIPFSSIMGVGANS